jgi:hypothetical protein
MLGIAWFERDKFQLALNGELAGSPCCCSAADRHRTFEQQCVSKALRDTIL